MVVEERIWLGFRIKSVSCVRLHAFLVRSTAGAFDERSEQTSERTRKQQDTKAREVTESPLLVTRSFTGAAPTCSLRKQPRGIDTRSRPGIPALCTKCCSFQEDSPRRSLFFCISQPSPAFSSPSSLPSYSFSLPKDARFSSQRVRPSSFTYQRGCHYFLFVSHVFRVLLQSSRTSPDLDPFPLIDQIPTYPPMAS